ncbi:MAG: YodC family protein [Desulfovibrionaceae bacterium]
MADFAIGDVVRLKSGGPKMTIVKVESLLEEQLFCVWIDSKQKEQRAAYPPEAVQYTEDD